MIYNVVTMIIRPGMMDSFLAEAKKIRPIVLAEKGCRMYDFTREIERSEGRQEPMNVDRITLYEKWDSQTDLDIHSASAHMKAYIDRVRPMRESVVIRTGTEAF